MTASQLSASVPRLMPRLMAAGHVLAHGGLADGSHGLARAVRVEEGRYTVTMSTPLMAGYVAVPIDAGGDGAGAIGVDYRGPTEFAVHVRCPRSGDRLDRPFSVVVLGASVELAEMAAADQQRATCQQRAM